MASAAVLLCVAFAPIGAHAADDVVQTENVNHLAGATATASGYEENSERLKPAHAVDGRRDTRWSSGSALPGKDEGTWLAVELPHASKLQFLDIQFEERGIPVQPGNVKGFEIQYQAPGSTAWTPAKTVANTANGQGWEPRVRVLLDAPIVASKIRLTNFDAARGNTAWNGVSIVELAAYTNEQPVTEDIGNVIRRLNGMGQQTVEADVLSLSAPAVPQGFQISLNGADFEQVIGSDSSVHHPLADKTVQISWKVAKQGTQESAITRDIAYLVKGSKTQEAGKNAKPTVVPEIQEWHSDSSDALALGTLTKVTYTDAALKGIVDEFVADYRDFTGKELTAAPGAAQAGAFNFTLGDPAGDALLGKEGYTMQITQDRIDVAAPAITGNTYAMQTILQMCKLDGSGFPIGQMRDYPRFPVRGFMWDIARKPISLEMVEMAARTMRYYKMNDLQLHLSDNLIFLENYGAEENQWQAYSAFRLETSIANSEGVTPTAKDYAIGKERMREFIKRQRGLGMNIVPEIDMPAHAVAFTRVWPELSVQGERVTTANGTTRSAIDHLDVRKPEARKLIRDIFDDYTRGSEAVFDTDTIVHIGADEFIIRNGRPAYCDFYNDLVPHLLESGHTPRVWGSFDADRWLYGGGTEPQDGSPSVTGVQMGVWSRAWANPQRMFDKGFSLINILDQYGYMVPDGAGSRGKYRDYLDTASLYRNFDPNNFDGAVLPSSDSKVLGSAYAIWNDNIDTNASGLSEADEYARFFDALPVYAENNWAPTGQEKGAGDAGFQNLSRIVAKTGDAPRVNPYSKVAKTGDTYARYDFEDGLADASANGRDLEVGKNAQVKDGKLLLAGGESYVMGKIDKIATGTVLAFDIELTAPARPGDILFEADAPYGTLDIRVMDDGKLGFTRELYDYRFDYKLPVGKKVRVEIETTDQKTTLKIDGEVVGAASGSFFNVYAGRVTKGDIENATFTLPLARIGSKTRSVAAKIDNIMVAPAAAEAPVDVFGKAAWRARSNSQTLTGEAAGGHIEHAFDGDVSTIWHSNWKAATSDNVDGNLKRTPMIWAEIDFGKGYEINELSFTPRSDGPHSGRITKASLKIKTSAAGEYKTVVSDQAFANNGKKKTMSFDTATVWGVRLEVSDANDHGGSKYVAVSEFDIANRPVRVNTVYVEGASYLAGQDGALDLSTAKSVDAVSGSLEDLEASRSIYRAELKAGSKLTVTAAPGEKLEFVGWFEPGAAAPVSGDLSYKVPTTYNVALEARFKRAANGPVAPPPVAKHTVRFMVDGVIVSTVEVDDGAAVSVPAPDPAKEGHAFDGWLLEGRAYDFAQPVTGDLTLTAMFTKNQANPGTNPQPGPGTNPQPGTGGDPQPGPGGTPQPGPGTNPQPGPGGTPQPGPGSDPRPGAGSQPDPGTSPQPDPGSQTDSQAGQRPSDKPGHKPAAKAEGKLVATGDIAYAAIVLTVLGASVLVTVGYARQRR